MDAQTIKTNQTQFYRLKYRTTQYKREKHCKIENQWKHRLIQVEDGFESITKCITRN